MAIPRLTGAQERAKIAADKATYATVSSAIALAVAEDRATGDVVVSSAASTGAITYTGVTGLLEPGAAFKLTANQGKKFTWTIASGDISAAPAISTDGVVTAD